mmetsp:Transcript_10717/g.33983  ORF Transcript_10717/g.33983 Transcript_10717/m.33983 type:complete len:252 (+) Transcript_10717:1438-2193(+)
MPATWCICCGTPARQCPASSSGPPTRGGTTRICQPRGRGSPGGPWAGNAPPEAGASCAGTGTARSAATTSLLAEKLAAPAECRGRRSWRRSPATTTFPVATAVSRGRRGCERSPALSSPRTTAGTTRTKRTPGAHTSGARARATTPSAARSGATFPAGLWAMGGRGPRAGSLAGGRASRERGVRACGAVRPCAGRAVTGRTSAAERPAWPRPLQRRGAPPAARARGCRLAPAIGTTAATCRNSWASVSSGL